jgi:hypothetical protein
VLGTVVFSGTNPLAAGTFPGGVPASVESALGETYIHADGTARFGAGGRAIKGIDYGKASPAIAVGGTGKATFNHGLGIAPIAVFLQLEASAGGARVLRADSADFTTTTFKIEYRSDAGALIADGIAPTTMWIAIV